MSDCSCLGCVENDTFPSRIRSQPLSLICRRLSNLAAGGFLPSPSLPLAALLTTSSLALTPVRCNCPVPADRFLSRSKAHRNAAYRPRWPAISDTSCVIRSTDRSRTPEPEDSTQRGQGYAAGHTKGLLEDVLANGQRRLSRLDDMIVSLYAGGITTRSIQHHLAATIGVMKTIS